MLNLSSASFAPKLRAWNVTSVSISYSILHLFSHTETPEAVKSTSKHALLFEDAIPDSASSSHNHNHSATHPDTDSRSHSSLTDKLTD